MCILDLTMPGMDGLNLLSRIREVSAHVPVVLVSGHSEQQILDRELSADVSFLQKPFSFAAFKTAIREQITGSTDSITSNSIH